MLGGDSFVKAGWVHSLRAHSFKHSSASGDRWLVMGKVYNYYTWLYYDDDDNNVGKTLSKDDSNPTDTIPWVVCQENGEILCAHCTCMAG